MKDGAPVWLAERSKATCDRMNELVMESTDIMNMTISDETKGYLQGLFLLTPNQLEEMISWVHTKYSKSKQDQADSQASDRVNSSQNGAQSTQSSNHSAQGNTQGDELQEARPQPLTPQNPSPAPSAISVEASQADRSGQSSVGQHGGPPKTKRRTTDDETGEEPKRPFNLWDDIEQ